MPLLQFNLLGFYKFSFKYLLSFVVNLLVVGGASSEIGFDPVYNGGGDSVAF